MKKFIPFLWMVLPLAGLLNNAQAELGTNHLRAGADVSLSFQGAAVHDHQALSIGPQAFGSFLNVSAYPWANRVGLDALLVYSNLIVFSTDVDFQENGVFYRRQDLVAYNANAGTFSKFFDGQAAGIPSGANLDAATLESETNILFSLDITLLLPNGNVAKDEDVIQYNSSGLSKAYRGGADLGISSRCDLDALYIPANVSTAVYYSLDVTEADGAQPVRPYGVWAKYTGLSTKPVIHNPGFPLSANLVCLDEPLDSDGDWLTDYEEASGLDEPSSTFPGTAIALSPNGHNSNPALPDTDQDDVPDGEEAAAGTRPRDQSDYLHLVSLVETRPEQEITWASVNGKRYELQSTDYLQQFTNTVFSGVVASGSLTTRTNALSDTIQFYRILLVP